VRRFKEISPATGKGCVRQIKIPKKRRITARRSEMQPMGANARWETGTTKGKRPTLRGKHPEGDRRQKDRGGG